MKYESIIKKFLPLPLPNFSGYAPGRICLVTAFCYQKIAKKYICMGGILGSTGIFDKATGTGASNRNLKNNVRFVSIIFYENFFLIKKISKPDPLSTNILGTPKGWH